MILIVGSSQEEEILRLYETFLLQNDMEFYIQNFKPEAIKKNNDNNDNQYYFGAIIGDCVGESYEFKEYGEIKELYNINCQFTDDTVLTIATLNAIKENSENPNFKKWYIKLFNEFPDAGYGSAFRSWCTGEIDNSKGYGSYANGSAMRVSPIGFFYENVEDVIKQAVRSSDCTHNHIDGIKGAVATAVICWMCKKQIFKRRN